MSFTPARKHWHDVERFVTEEPSTFTEIKDRSALSRETVLRGLKFAAGYGLIRESFRRANTSTVSAQSLYSLKNQ